MGKRFLGILVALVLGLVPLQVLTMTASADANPTLVSLDSQEERIGSVSHSQISSDGRYVVFMTNGPDGEDPSIYLRDLFLGTTTLVSTDANGVPLVFEEGVSQMEYRDGLLFFSARGLTVEPESSDGVHIYRKDLTTQALDLVSRDAAGEPLESILGFHVSKDGTVLAWTYRDPVELSARVVVSYLASNTMTVTDILGSRVMGLSGNGEYLFYAASLPFGRQGLIKYDIQEASSTSLNNGSNQSIERVDSDYTGDTIAYISWFGDGGVFVIDTNTLVKSQLATGGNRCVDTRDGVSISDDGVQVVYATGKGTSSGCSQRDPLFIFGYNQNTTSNVLLGVNDYGNKLDNRGSVGYNALTADGSVMTFVTDASNAGVYEPGTHLAYVKSTTSTEPESFDTEAPEVTSIDIDNPVIQVSQTAQITITAEDVDPGEPGEGEEGPFEVASGVVNGEFLLEDNGSVEPAFATVIGFHNQLEKGYGTPMVLTEENTLVGTIGDDVAPGEYTVYARAQDLAGNWSTYSDAQLVVIGPEDVTLTPSADTYVRGGQTNRNHGADTIMQIQSSGSNRSLVRFDQQELEEAGDNREVLSATLRLNITDNGNNWGTTGRTVDVHRMLTDWAEGNGTVNDRGIGEGATWSCAIDSLIENQAKDCNGDTEWEMGQPNNPEIHPWFVFPTATQTITNGLTGVIEFDVTADIVAFLNGESDNYGWLIKKTNEGQNGQASFGTRESSFGAELFIVFE